jgi:hypothetical protein
MVTRLLLKWQSHERTNSVTSRANSSGRVRGHQ